MYADTKGTKTNQKAKQKLTQHAINRFPTLKCSGHCLGDSVVSGDHGMFVPVLPVVTTHDLDFTLLVTKGGKMWDLNKHWAENTE